MHCSASARPWLDAGRVCGVIAPEGPVAVDAVVLAAGAWASETWPAVKQKILRKRKREAKKQAPAKKVKVEEPSAQ